MKPKKSIASLLKQASNGQLFTKELCAELGLIQNALGLYSKKADSGRFKECIIRVTLNYLVSIYILDEKENPHTILESFYIPTKEKLIEIFKGFMSLSYLFPQMDNSACCSVFKFKLSNDMGNTTATLMEDDKGYLECRDKYIESKKQLQK